MKFFFSLLLWGAVIFGIVALLKKIKSNNSSSTNEAWPVFAKKTLLNEKEQVVFNRLTEAFPDWIVLAQVALSQIVIVKSGKENGPYRNKIYKKVIDFVVCRPDTSIVVAIELDGNSHDSPGRSKSDVDKENALSSAGIKLARMNTKDLPNGPQLRAMFASDVASHTVR
jgi:hypothetical protein